MTTKQTMNSQSSIEAQFERAVLERLNLVLPAAVHEAVHACLTVAANDPVERKVQNGIREPQANGRCDAVWKRLDKMRGAGMQPTLAEAQAVSAAEGWNSNNTRIEFYNWRRFHGLGAVVTSNHEMEHRRANRRVKAGKAPRKMKDRRTVERRMAA